MKTLKYFSIVIAQLAIVEFVIWIHSTEIGWHIEELLPGDAISLWGTVAIKGHQDIPERRLYNGNSAAWHRLSFAR